MDLRAPALFLTNQTLFSITGAFCKRILGSLGLLGFLSLLGLLILLDFGSIGIVWSIRFLGFVGSIGFVEFTEFIESLEFVGAPVDRSAHETESLTSFHSCLAQGVKYPLQDPLIPIGEPLPPALQREIGT